MGGGDGVRRAEAAKLTLATTSFHYATYESGDQPARSQHFTSNASRNAVATTHQHATARLPPGGNVAAAVNTAATIDPPATASFHLRATTTTATLHATATATATATLHVHN